MAVELKDGGQLTRFAIVDAAIAMIETDGVEALTMRKLARACGAAPMSLYRHIETKQDLLRAVADRHLSQVELPDVGTLPWDEAIKRVIMAINDRFEAVPRLADIMAVQPVDVTATLLATELILRALRAGGIEGDAALPALALLSAYATGHAQRRAERRQNATARERRRAHIDQLDETEFATLRAFGDRVLELDSTAQFEAGLDLLLGALRQNVFRMIPCSINPEAGAPVAVRNSRNSS